MSLAARVGRRSGEGLLVVAAGAALGVVLTIAIATAGPISALVPLGIVACWWLFWHPVATLGLLFATTAWFEESQYTWPVETSRWYAAIGGILHAPDVLVALLVGWVLVDRRRRDTPGPGLGSFAVPLCLLCVAVLGGITTGYLAGAEVPLIYNAARVLAYLVAVPYAAAAVLVGRGAVRRAVVFATGVVVARAMVGLIGWIVNGRGAGPDGLTGVAASLDRSSSSFYEPTMNLLIILVLLGILGAAIVRLSLPRWLWVAAPLLVITLAVSYRRSFWIAAVLGLILVGLVASGRRGRPWLVLGGMAVAVALWAAIFAGGTTDTTNPVLYRAQSLTPSKLVTTSGDRYRLDEQRNVIAEIRANPLTGLGLGVPWTARYPVAENPPGGRYYTHVTPLWFYLKLGPFGFVAYVWLMGAAIAGGIALWRRRSNDLLVRVTGLALAAGFVGLVVAELTGPFSGIDVRTTLVVACLFGWLIAARWRPGDPTETTADGRRVAAIAARD